MAQGRRALSAAALALLVACTIGSGCASILGIDPPDIVGVDGAALPPSCASGDAGAKTCGPIGASCCASTVLPAGTFARSYDHYAFPNRSATASVSAFRLDRYEVTVGRFRPFVAAVASGWLPGDGAGKHRHLDDGGGLIGSDGGHESGWDSTDWNPYLERTTTAWNSALSGGTWTAQRGDDVAEARPITMIDWFEAYAFCIWDDGFLPSEAEWNYAAAGGSDQRVYPWSSAYPPGSTDAGCAYANYACQDGGGGIGAANAVGSEAPTGDGKWGQSDLAGNVWEWVLDSFGPYFDPCTDCAYLELMTTPYRTMRGGSYADDARAITASNRYQGVNPTQRSNDVGVRCARTP